MTPKANRVSTKVPGIGPQTRTSACCVRDLVLGAETVTMNRHTLCPKRREFHGMQDRTAVSAFTMHSRRGVSSVHCVHVCVLMYM